MLFIREVNNKEVGPTMQTFLVRNAWWLVSIVALGLLISHTFDWKMVKVDSTSLILLAIILFSPFLGVLKKIKIGDIEAEIDPEEIRRVRDKMEAYLPDAGTGQGAEHSLPEVREAVDNINELAKTDHIMALAKLRIELEKALRRLYNLSRPNESRSHPVGIGSMIHVLSGEEMLQQNITSPLREVVGLCNRAVHGEEVRSEDATAIVGIGSSLLLALYDELSHFTPNPKESVVITQDEVERYQSATFRVMTIVPYLEGPVRNTYYLNQEGVDQFLENYNEFAEFVVEITRLDK